MRLVIILIAALSPMLTLIASANADCRVQHCVRNYDGSITCTCM